MQELTSLLNELESGLQLLGLWQQHAPTADDLASKQPFCIDTLDFHQWLQFIFLPQMRELIDQSGPLPDNCQIAPMAEEYFQSMPISADNLLNILQRLDRLLSA